MKRWYFFSKWKIVLLQYLWKTIKNQTFAPPRHHCAKKPFLDILYFVERKRVSACKIILYTSVNPCHVIKRSTNLSLILDPHSFGIHHIALNGWWTTQREVATVKSCGNIFFVPGEEKKIQLSSPFMLLSPIKTVHYALLSRQKYVRRLFSRTKLNNTAALGGLLYHHQQQSSFTVLMANTHTQE